MEMCPCCSSPGTSTFNRCPVNLHNIIEAIRPVRPDIVTLQEVKTSLADDMKRRLSNMGLVHAYWSGKDAPPMAMRKLPPVRRLKRRIYQCLIASRWPVTAGGNRWRRRAPYPELMARATVSVPDEEDIDVFTVHIPNVPTMAGGRSTRSMSCRQSCAGESTRPAS